MVTLCTDAPPDFACPEKTCFSDFACNFFLGFCQSRKKSRMPRDACDNLACRPLHDAHNFCGRCRSRTYCSVECQRTDWAKHKVQCRGLAALRVEFEAKHGFAPDSGQHPALTYRHNLVTGKSMDEMRPPHSREELEANSRQSMSSILVTINIRHPLYVPMASSLALTTVKCPDWEKAFETAIQEMMVDEGFSRFDARRLVGYREGEYITLCSELRHKLGVEQDAEVDATSPAPGVVRGSLLAVPPNAKNEELINDAWLVQIGARFPQVTGLLPLAFPPHPSPCTGLALRAMSTEGIPHAALLLTNQSLSSIPSISLIYSPQLEEAHLPFAKDLTPAGLAPFVASLPRLRVLNLVGAHAAVDDTVLDALARRSPPAPQNSFFRVWELRILIA